RTGITALQMDIKIKGVTREILKEALEQARKARFEILDVMENIISETRSELSPYAPKIETFNIDPDKIKDVIGRGGEMITKIILEASNVKTVNDKDAVKVDLEDEDVEEEENEMVCLGVKSCTVYSGGRKLPSNPTTKINVNGPFERVHIDFDHNY
ncbi:MAG: hypothetical protein IJZ55_02160, partial [Lachnospiraceae bacterium]|nr:hypothetical protein [Lachnospiraceae bacterium]